MKNVQIFVYKQTILPVLEKLHHAHIQLRQNSSQKTQIHIFRDKSSGHTCLEWVLLSTIYLIHYFILLNVVNLPTPESMLSEVKERLEGLKYHLDFG